ncbi:MULTISPECIES: hypothetical protein [unclassified Streptomyces]|uniref:hypothetical protein n=1 Tax=unclassified Streptomyces TaxID=2593676 RepID=UPI0033DAADF6
MSAGLRARLTTGVGVMAGVVALAIASAAPASAATYFWADTTNRAAHANLYYQYDSPNNGYYHITVDTVSVNDSSYGDGWGGRLYMHYTSRTGTHTETLATAPDEGFDGPADFERTGYKDVWFELCNHSDSTGQIASCARLHK